VSNTRNLGQDLVGSISTAGNEVLVTDYGVIDYPADMAALDAEASATRFWQFRKRKELKTSWGQRFHAEVGKLKASYLSAAR
jgi:hypothetical protein